MKRVTAGVVAALIMSAGVPAGAVNEAGLPGEFLNFGAGARSLGMGRAFTGVADDVESIYWNPAGLATFRSSQVVLQHAPLDQEGSYQFLAYSQPLYGRGSLGVGLVNVGSPNVPRIDSNNAEVGSFDHRETGYLVSYAQRFGERLGLGTTVKMAENSTDGRTERGFGLDLGGIYRWGERVRVGAVLHNAVPPVYDFSTDKERFPTIFRTGVSSRFFRQHLLAAADVEKTLGIPQNPRWHLGLEGSAVQNVFLRLGLDQTEITSGVGLRWRTIQFDYAMGFQTVGLVNRFSLKFFFGGFEVDVKASPAVFSPLGLKNRVAFKISAANRSRITRWIMSIRNTENAVVKSYEGYNTPPAVLEWDGRDDKGQVVPAGKYTYRLVTTDAKNQSERTPERYITVVAPNPIELEAH
jgi:hypothetical protein